MIRVFVIDDHHIMRDGLRRILAEQADIEWVGEADNGRQAMAELQEKPCDIVLVGISMPDMDGLELLKRFKTLAHPPRVLILAVHAEATLAMRFIKAGARGFVTKKTASRQLIEAMHQVANGGCFIIPEIAEQLARQLGHEMPAVPHELLSNREYSVFRRLVAGHGISRIAKEMSLSPSTISTYRTRILDKLQVENNAGLIRYAREQEMDI
ncbi:MAG: response regulator transcription factor [Magnetococcales bacterium]|nr:response regulator transcription factor [Magnetococcales bacterium]